MHFSIRHDNACAWPPQGKYRSEKNFFSDVIQWCSEKDFLFYQESVQMLYQNAQLSPDKKLIHSETAGLQLCRQNITFWRFSPSFFLLSNAGWLWSIKVNSLKRQPDKVVIHNQTTRRLLATNCLSVFDHFVGLALKGLRLLSFKLNFSTCLQNLKTNKNLPSRVKSF